MKWFGWLFNTKNWGTVPIMLNCRLNIDEFIYEYSKTIMLLQCTDHHIAGGVPAIKVYEHATA